ncbi:MAG: exo-alpha-sialidase [Burkholderiales bacterium]|nr:exo-alpha-sialidase [Burkholderiales bacterium]
MHTILLGTRKGLFVVNGTGADWNIAAHHFAGDAVSQVLSDPRNGAWYAAMALGHFGIKLRKSTDRGATWTEVGAPAFPAKPATGPLADDPTPWNVELIWSLAAGGGQEPGTLWAGCLPAGLFKSTDGGATWALCNALWEHPKRREWMGGGYDHPGIHSLLVDPRDARHLTLAISSGGVWQTRDAGATWENTGRGLKAPYMPPERVDDPNVQDAHCVVHCAANPDVLWMQHHGGIYRSIDAGQSWTSIDQAGPSTFGFPVAAHPADPDRAWFVPAQADACRFPVDARMVVTRTDDGGRSFKVFGAGLPSAHAYHLVYRHALAVAADGRTLAMASTTGGFWISGDAAESWHCISRDLPPVAAVRFVD